MHKKMPVLFLGHGSPMNAIEENEFVKGFRDIAQEIRQPKAIICISAHWETRGTYLTAMEKPKTIHDFGGFPAELYNVQYNAPGNATLALKIKENACNNDIKLDNEQWGLDHGAWSVLKHLYPKAEIPVIQMSLDYTKKMSDHISIAKEIDWLRKNDVLMIGSGNIVHNLRILDWKNINKENHAFDWTRNIQEKVNTLITNNDINALVKYENIDSDIKLAVPTPEHYLPMLYCMALRDENDDIKLFNDKAVGGSITMTSFKIG